MKIRLKVSKKQYIIAAKLMTPDKERLIKLRILYSILTVFFLGAAFLLSRYYFNGWNAILSILIVLAAISGYFIIRTFRNWDGERAAKNANIPVMEAEYEFGEDALRVAAAGRETSLSWDGLKSYGEFENHIYMIFPKKQTVVLDKAQLKEREVDEILAFLSQHKNDR